MNLEGGCCCGAVRYRLTDSPLIVHACHCRDCARLSGGLFTVNAWIEADAVTVTSGAPRAHRLKGGSGKDHEVFFCATCGTQVWSRYHAAPGSTLFVRVGTLDEPERLAPDVHIYTRSKQPWLPLPEDVPSFEAFYDLKTVWPAEKRARLRATAQGG
jgi:hypothetical protein